MATAEKTAMEGLGCCFGTMFAMAGLADESSTKTKDDPAAIANQMAACGMTLSSTPCAMPGIKQTEVKAQTKLAGVTVAQFDSTAQTAFKAGMAKTCGVASQKVVISGFKETTVRRATGLEVDSQVLLTGDAVDTASSVKTKMADTSALTTNIQAAGTSSNLASASVSSSASQTSAVVAADPSVQVGAVGMSAQASLATLALCLAAALMR